jgi:hypothetical protein
MRKLQMRGTYENADMVLVVESTLLGATVHASSEELMMRIGCSLWVARLWTLQEGVLARNLRYRLGDWTTSSVELLNLYLRQHRNADSRRLPTLCDTQFKRLLEEEMSQDTLQVFESFLNAARLDSLFVKAGGYLDIIECAYIREGELYQRLAALESLLKWRSTSKMEDEAICLATVLGLDMGEPLEMAPD